MTSVEAGKTITLTATITPDNATDKTINWSSGNKSVATVDKYGLVTGVSTGEAIITAKAGGKSKDCTVTVTAPVETTLTLSKNSVELVDGNSTTITAVVTPTNTTLTWSVSPLGVITLTGSGNERTITAVAPGTATITVSGGGVTKEITVTVKAPGEIVIPPQQISNFTVTATNYSQIIVQAALTNVSQYEVYVDYVLIESNDLFLGSSISLNIDVSPGIHDVYIKVRALPMSPWVTSEKKTVTVYDLNFGTLVMLEYIIEKNGGTVTWNNTTKSYEAKINGVTQSFGITDYVMSNGKVLVGNNILISKFGLSEISGTALHQPYDGFNSADDAAMAFVLMENPKTHRDNRERGAFICKAITIYGTFYYYEDTPPGEHRNVVVNAIAGIIVGGGPAFVKIQGVNRPVIGANDSFVHTHPGCTGPNCGDDMDNSEWFSSQDISLLPSFVELSFVYLGTPAGKLKRYNDANFDPPRVESEITLSNKMPIAKNPFTDCDTHP